MKLSFPATVVLFVTSAWAQPNPWFYQPLEQVKEFLKLSDSQLQAILTNNDEYNRWSFEKQNRIRQVQTEIVDETKKEPLDPNGLGIRYAEVESICREMKDRANEYYTRNIGLLDSNQKAKLNVLEEAIKLAPAISEAQSGNLISGLSSVPYAFTSASNGTTTGSIFGAILGGISGCYLPFGGLVRSGDFSGTLPAGNVAQPARDVPPFSAH
jgi:hypothetical protein